MSVSSTTPNHSLLANSLSSIQDGLSSIASKVGSLANRVFRLIAKPSEDLFFVGMTLGLSSSLFCLTGFLLTGSYALLFNHAATDIALKSLGYAINLGIGGTISAVGYISLHVINLDLPLN